MPGLHFSCLCILLGHMSAGAALISSSSSPASPKEPPGWSFGEAFYFCFLSLLTVGGGGLRPSDRDVWPCAVYLILGAAVVAACAFVLWEDVFERVGRYRAMEKRRKVRIDIRMLHSEDWCLGNSPSSPSHMCALKSFSIFSIFQSKMCSFDSLGRGSVRGGKMLVPAAAAAASSSRSHVT